MTSVSSTALEASHILAPHRARFVGVIGYNASESAQFIQVHNSATVPADGAVPIVTFTAAASSNFSQVPPRPIECLAGVVICNSSTADTKTGGDADCFFTAQIA